MILLQHNFGDQSLLNLSEPIHLAYAKRHSAGFIVSTENLVPNLPLQWNKFQLMLMIAKNEKDDELLIWLDHDCLIIGDEEFNIPPLADFGAVWNLDLKFNTGVIVMRNSQRSREYFEQCLDLGEMPKEELHDQSRFNYEIHQSLIRVDVLNSRWNYYYNAWGRPQHPIQIMAWHDMDKHSAVLEMRKEIHVLRKT